MFYFLEFIALFTLFVVIFSIENINDYKGDVQSNLDPFHDGLPKFPVGQIIFDINGEYANPNMQDEGTAIYELYKDDTIRYSLLEKPGFENLANEGDEVPEGNIKKVSS